jgi:hypothetical protein
MALDTLRQYNKLMHDLASRFAGSMLEEVRKQMPDQTSLWGPEQWAEFWRRAILLRGEEVGHGIRISRSLRDETATNRKPDGSSANAADLQQQLERANDLLREARAEAEQLRTRNVEKSMMGISPKRKETRANQNQAELFPKHLVPTSMAYSDIVSEIKELPIPECPEEYKEIFLVKEGVNYSRLIHVLRLIAMYGISTRIEIDRILSGVLAASDRNGGLKKTFERLRRNDIIASDTVITKSPFETSLAMVSLKGRGREICTALGWKIIESEAERLAKYYKNDRARIAYTLTFAMHARMRGWRVSLLAGEGRQLADARVEREDLSLPVIVECLNSRVTVDAKEIARQSPNDKVGICGLNERQCQELLESCQECVSGGFLTDIGSLTFKDKQYKEARHLSEIGPTDKLWVSSW